MCAASLESSGALDGVSFGATGNSTLHAKHFTWGRFGVLMVFLGICLEIVGQNQWEILGLHQAGAWLSEEESRTAVPGGDERV